MEKLFFNGVDIFNPLQGKMDKVIDYFVNFYGEKYRERITEKLMNTTFIFLPQIDRFDKITYFSLLLEKQFKIENELFKSVGERYRVDLFDEYGEHVPIDLIARSRDKFKNNQPMDEYEKVVLEYFSMSCHPKNSKENILKKFDDVLLAYNNQVLPKITQLTNEKEIIIKQLTSLIPDVKKLGKQAKIDMREMMENQFYGLLEKRGIKIADENELNSITQINGKWKSVSVETLKQLEVFCELIKQEALPLIATPSQKEKYIKFFNFLGFNYGSNYANYYSDTALSDVIFDENLIHSLNRREKELEVDQTCANPLLMEALQEVFSLNIKYNVNRQDVIRGINSFVNDGSFMGFEISYLEGETNKLKSVCVCRDYLRLSTATIVHEMNHIIEDCLVGEDDEAFYTKSGFDIIPFEKTESNCFDYSKFMKGENRTFESFSEIVNEYIALKIAEDMKKDGFFLGAQDDEEDEALYRNGFYIFDKLISENKNLIIESRLSNDSLGLGRYLGLDEFKKLAGIADDVLYSERQVLLAESI